MGNYEAREFAEAALVAMAGIVPTPEKGYMEDGGPMQMKRDIESMIRLFKHEIDLRQKAFESERDKAIEAREAARWYFANSGTLAAEGALRRGWSWLGRVADNYGPTPAKPVRS